MSLCGQHSDFFWLFLQICSECQKVGVHVYLANCNGEACDLVIYFLMIFYVYITFTDPQLTPFMISMQRVS